MQPNPNGIEMPVGWATWIEEDFAVPWYLTLIFAIIASGVFGFALWYNTNHGPKANGWTIGTGPLTMLSFVFPVWVLKAKDSKHAKL